MNRVSPYFRAALGALLALTLICFAMAANAGTVPLTWTLPTKYTDGSNIAAPVTIKVYRATTQAGLAAAPVLVTTAAGATGYTDATAPVGPVWYQVSAVVGGVESARTSAVTVTVPNPTPEAPTNLTATVQVADTNAYKQRQGVDGFSLVSIGTVPPLTVCDLNHVVRVAGVEYALVPRSAVTMRNKFDPKPTSTYARCG